MVVCYEIALLVSVHMRAAISLGYAAGFARKFWKGQQHK